MQSALHLPCQAVGADGHFQARACKGEMREVTHAACEQSSWNTKLTSSKDGVRLRVTSQPVTGRYPCKCVFCARCRLMGATTFCDRACCQVVGMMLTFTFSQLLLPGFGINDSILILATSLGTVLGILLEAAKALFSCSVCWQCDPTEL